ncbi:hypothetical protein [Candidatus Enterococcus clewellii]|uniref:Uncharacterized protein n=1 Tax=Candidatus Enterococcus clewellii TaxID=1834193 RepID=A0A242K3I7_9ENTE|nr:hypothetical protein [Enterococcus sp. 9E7_DIV0242]OTP13558.1 hypothetical protein A5888_003036 [Enterococcus sp. 9E7_DIV0242]
MTTSLTNFFDNLPVNHWSSLLVGVLSLAFFIYSIYFFFSKEGKDERGRKILATASFTAFVVTVAALFVFNIMFYEVATHSSNAYSWMMNLIMLIVSATEALMITSLKKVI